MPRDIVRDPETGKPALVKVSYEIIELDHLRDTLDKAQAEHTKLIGEKRLLDKALEASESRLEDAKSELQLAQEVVDDTSPGSDLDTGEDGTGSDVEAEADESTVAQTA